MLILFISIRRLIRTPSGQVSQAQFHAFTDTWSWADAADTYHQFVHNCPNLAVVGFSEALVDGEESGRRIDAPLQINPFAMAAREQKQHEQAETL